VFKELRQFRFTKGLTRFNWLLCTFNMQTTDSCFCWQWFASEQSKSSFYESRKQTKWYLLI